MQSETLQNARYYLSRGFHPIPLAPRTKKPPICKGGWKAYQSTPPTDAELERWFIRGENNIALVVGRGILVVDLDGPGAEEALAAAGVTLPEDAPRSRTSNGSHVLLKINQPLGNRAPLLHSPDKNPATGKYVWQVDIRADGGYIVAPPSVHPSGAVYEWLQRPDTLPDAPEALLSLMAQKPTATAILGGPAAAPKAPKWVAEALRGTSEGGRDQMCARLAGYFLGKHIPEDIVRQQLLDWAARCTPPFTAAEVDKTLTSVAGRTAAAGEAAALSAADAVVNQPFFQILGYNQGIYFYLPRGSRQVVELRAEQHSKLQLLRLAPLQYWEREYASKNGVQWDLAANALLRRAEAAGVYDTARVRGRGAWWDEDHAVLHLGDTLITRGRAVPIHEVPPSKFIYEAAAPMPIQIENPLDVADANRIVEIASLVNWERPISSLLFAGWAAVAPICGALTWRPHIWITGPAGSGKTWVIDNVLRRLIGDMGLAVQSETTEAGLRQTLGHDARPTVFDEAEGEDQRAQQRIQNILALVRQASSESGSMIIKGSPLGMAKTYRIRSCFAFSSIGVGIDKHADATRVSVLSIEKRHNPEQFRRLEALVAQTITEEYVRRLIARSIHMAPTIRENARTFAAAGAETIGSQRLGDQIGALLAGAYSLHSDAAITLADARAWIEEQDWTEQKGVQDETDEAACLRRILEHTVFIQVPGKGPSQRSVGELVRSTALLAADDVRQEDAEAVLWRMGIRVDRAGDLEHFTISNNHTAIAELLKGTQWKSGWARVLRRLPGAQATDSTVRFGAARGRGVQIPLEVVA